MWFKKYFRKPRLSSKLPLVKLSVNSRMHTRISYIMLSFLLNFSLCDSARILAVFPIPSISHQIVFRPLTQELAKRGHEVTVVTTDPAFPKGKTPANLTEINVHFSYEFWRERLLLEVTGKKEESLGQKKVAFELSTIVFEKQMQVDEIQSILRDKDKNFDLLLLETYSRPALGLSYKYKVPVILLSSFGAFIRNYDIVGAPTHPILYPGYSTQKLYNLSTWDKAELLIYDYKVERTLDLYENDVNEMLKRVFGEGIPPLSKLNENIEMLFLNTYPIWEGNFPVPPTVIYMGGMHQKPQKELPQDLQIYLDQSKNGVIYMSFGTNTNPSALPPEKIQIFVKVFSQLTYDVLWKWDKDELPGQTKNIKIQKWFPQYDLLRHPKVKLFITQGGLQSTDEAITSGVPLIGIPMLGDQWYNVEKYVYHKIGVRLDMDSLTEKKLHETIDLVMGDESYKHNIARLRTLMRDEPNTALDRAVWWTEYVLRHGGAKHLRAAAANMSWVDYFELKLVFLVLISLVIVIVVLIFVITRVISYFSVPSMKNKFD